MMSCSQRACDGREHRRSGSERSVGLGHVRPGVAAILCAIWVAGAHCWCGNEAQAADGNVQQAASPSADQEMQRGTARFHQGAFAQAAVHWSKAARLYEEDERTEEQCRALINLAHALHQEGQIKRAMATLQAALNLSEQAGNRPLTASILGRLGNAAYGLGKGDQAVDHLSKGLAIAREEKSTTLVAVMLNDLGNVLSSRNQSIEAIDVYGESRRFALETGQRALAVTAQINLATAFLDDQQFIEAERQFDIASSDIQQLEDSYVKAYGLLNIGLGYDDLQAALSAPKMMAEAGPQLAGGTKAIGGGRGEPGNGSSPPDQSLLRQASDSFVSAAQVATRLGDPRAQSYAWGYLGRLLEKERRYGEALTFTRQAAFAAQRGNIPESLYRWHWQTGRLLKATGKDEESLTAYQQSVAILKPIRYEYSVGYQGRHHSFGEAVAPLFTELEDTLLRRAAVATTPEQTQQLLALVRDTIEASHAAELQDYFHDDCIATARAKHRENRVPRDTAVLYPILLPDRIELLLETDRGFTRHGIAVPVDKLTREIRSFRRLVQDRGSRSYLGPAQTLYAWLIAPVQPELLASGVTTLVVVPDGPLRTMPLAALHDGRQFLVDRYAVAVTPGMELTDAQASDRGQINLLSMGLTSSVQGFPPLPNAAAEVEYLNRLYGGRSLLDQQFVVRSMEQEMKSVEFEVVHIAAHGVLDRDAKSSFVLAYDDKITMDRLSQLVGGQQYRNRPLDLLTLSASDTAAEDDRAALGLTGVALKAGARSALASLWVSDDRATVNLVEEFYRQLQDSTVSKAVALQRAQQKVLSEPGHTHPGYWAPFLLLSNWM
ncbi:CHAT domain-containing protein [Nitrospira sp. Nam80]